MHSKRFFVSTRSGDHLDTPKIMGRIVRKTERCALCCSVPEIRGNLASSSNKGNLLIHSVNNI